jgi:CubicO group peptidase (beta-lactamase class C family)
VGWVEQTMTPGDLSSQYGLGWWLGLDPHGHPTWLAQDASGQLIAVVPELKLVVAIGSVPTSERSLADIDIWLWASDVIVPALGSRQNHYAPLQRRLARRRPDASCAPVHVRLARIGVQEKF